MRNGSNAVEVVACSCRVACADDGHLDDAELAMRERPVREDGRIDHRERPVLHNILERARRRGVSADVDAGMTRFAIGCGI
ncbi:MAG: hypothetical protein QNJ91_07065 [Gammaproteobacteria bacterium]|nr:hypothetical protein [Gammaproteobacteria bacterium]